MKKKAILFVKNPLTYGSFLMVFGSLGANAINYIYHLVMGRILGPLDYGVLASIYSVLYIVSIIPQSSSITIVKFISQAKSKEERASIYSGVFSLVYKIGLWGTLFLFLITPFIRNFLHIQTLWPVLWVPLIFYTSILVTANQAALQGLLSFWGVVLSNFTLSILKFILGVFLIYLGFSVSGTVFAVLLAVLMAYLLSHRFIKIFNIDNVSNLKPKFDVAKFINYSKPVVLQSLAFTSIFTVDLILVKHFFPELDAGLYAALSTLGKIIFFAASPVTSVMFPMVAAKKSKNKPFFNVFLISLGITITIMLAFVCVYTFLPSFTIGLLYGQKYLKVTYALPWMGVFIAIYTICLQIVNFCLSVDDTKVVLYPIVGAIAQIALIWMFHNSILGVIQISTAVVFVILLFLTVRLMYNHKNGKY